MINSCIINTSYYLELFITDLSGNPKTSLTATYSIYKSLDDSLIESGSLIDIGNGIYKKPYIFTELGQYYILYTVPDGYTDEVESILVIQDYAKSNDLLRLLGLSDENKRIFDTVHDVNGNLLSATVKIYPSATDLENDTNVLATYNFVATYNISNLMQTVKVTRIL